MTTLLIAHGPNSVVMPCMVFESAGDALAFFKEISDVDLQPNEKGQIHINVEERYDITEEKTLFRIFNAKLYNEEVRKLYEQKDLSCNELRVKVIELQKICGLGKEFDSRLLFKSYYSGCGGAGLFEIREITEENYRKPLFSWDLD